MALKIPVLVPRVPVPLVGAVALRLAVLMGLRMVQKRVLMLLLCAMR